MVDQFREYQSNTKKFDGEISDKENRVNALKKEIDEESSSLAKLRWEEKVLRKSISSLESKIVGLDSKFSDLINQIKKREEEYHKLMEMQDDASKKLEGARKTLRKYNQGFKDYDDLNMEIARLRNTYNSLDEEYREKREQVDLGLALFNLLREPMGYDREGLKLMCRNLVESPAVRDNDLHKIKMKATETLIRLTQNNLVVLSSTDGDMLKIKFVSKEEYYENMQKLLEIEKMKEEAEKIQQMIKNEAYKYVKAELESRGDDPAIRPYIKEAVKQLIIERYKNEAQRISKEELAKSFNRLLLSSFKPSVETNWKENRQVELVRIVSIDSSGRTGEDMISLENALRSLLEGKEVEGSHNYYDGCDLIKAMILYYANKKVPSLAPIRKKTDIKISKGVIFHSTKQ